VTVELRVLVVDDEAPARRRMRRMLASASGVLVVGEAADGFEAIAEMARQPVDLIMLDIHMPDMEGTRLAARLRDLDLPRTPLVVMVTAHAEHAAKAFDLDVVDYVLKPLSSERLATTLERVRRRLHAGDERSPSPGLPRPPDPPRPPRAQPPVPPPSAPKHMLDAGAITRLHAEDKYVIARIDGREYVLDESLNALERRLAEGAFLRVHRSELVRLDKIVALHADEAGAEVELKDGQRAPVSRRRLADLRRALGL